MNDDRPLEALEHTMATDVLLRIDENDDVTLTDLMASFTGTCGHHLVKNRVKGLLDSELVEWLGGYLTTTAKGRAVADCMREVESIMLREEVE